LFASALLPLDIRTTVPSFENNRQFSGKASLKAGSFGLFNPAFYVAKHFSNRLVATVNGEWLSANGKYPSLSNTEMQKETVLHGKKEKNTDVQNFRLESAVFGKNIRKIVSPTSGSIIITRIVAFGVQPYSTTLMGFSKQRLDENTFFVQHIMKMRFRSNGTSKPTQI
jgi:hypothetical protein